MLDIGAILSFIRTTMTSLMFYWAIYKQYLPDQHRDYFEKYFSKVVGWFSTKEDEYVYIRFTEYRGNILKSKAYNLISNYLSAKSTARAKRLRAHETKDSNLLVLSLDNNEGVQDEFKGVNVSWSLNVSKNENKYSSKKYLVLSFHEKDRELITKTYLDHVLRQGKEIKMKNRERKLYTVSQSCSYSSDKDGRWRSIPFDHPSTFDTLAMDPEKKEAIKKELVRFSKSKDFYREVGKPWKRGYLLYGPPGTGKSSMISAMANFMDYDVYDIELTTMQNNLELKKLVLDATEKSILVIEDIDCSLDLTGQRKIQDEDEDEDEDEEKKHKGKVKTSNVTLSGLLNAIDGLWSACTGEKIIVFTANFVDKLDSALIRRGRMDNHIEMSYCRFEGFKVLARNYLHIESHDMFGEIKRLLEETDMSPADVAEDLMFKSDEEDVDVCLMRLVKSLEEEKEKARKLAEEEKKKKVERGARRIKKKAEQEEKSKETEENGDVAEENGEEKART